MYSFGLAHCKWKPYFYLTLLQFLLDILKSKPVTITFGFYAGLVLHKFLNFLTVDGSDQYEPENVVIYSKQRSNKNHHHFATLD